MLVVYSERHLLHSPTKELWGGRPRPHPDVPDRAELILRELQDCHSVVSPGKMTRAILHGVHSAAYVDHVEACSSALSRTSEAFPFAFPRAGSAPANPVARRGFYSYDTVTPVTGGTFSAALSAAACAVSGARHVFGGRGTAYCLCRPPGHHATESTMGGYCYFNNAALAAAQTEGRVAIIDVDSHHGNGTQEIFYDTDRVLCCSLHGHPRSAFPYAWGFRGERGMGNGVGYNINVPLPGESRGGKWIRALRGLLVHISKFEPDYLIVSLGVDGLAEDRNGPLILELEDYARAGKAIAELGYPTCIVQEGGYFLPLLATCTSAFLSGWP